MKLKNLRQSKNLQDQRGPTSAYMSGPIGQRVTARRGKDYMNAVDKLNRSRVKISKPKVK